MALDLRDLSFAGSALPEPFVKFELEAQLQKLKLLPKLSPEESAAWEVCRRKLRLLGDDGGERRVASHVLAPLAEALGYTHFEEERETVRTREGDENAGWRLRTADGSVSLRAWATGVGADLDAPSKRGRAYRFSHARVAERVLLAAGERVGLLTDGYELRILLCDPARAGSHVAIRLDRAGGWRGAKSLPDSFRLLRALCGPAGIPKIPELIEQARLSQSRVTKTLRAQAQSAVLDFVQALLDDARNADLLRARREADPAALAQDLWREALVVVYRLLFVLRLESASDPARAFSFASTSLWRNTYSPNTALARFVDDRLRRGAETGSLLSQGLRTLFRLFEEGLDASEIRIAKLGGMLFGRGTTPLLDALAWNDDAVARLLDRLLWTPAEKGRERQRVHYGSLEVEDLGRVYEALLEKEPGIATEPMCRLRRQKLEVVLPAAQGQRYRPADPAAVSEETDDTDDADEEESSKRARVAWIEAIPAGRFYLRTGLGRKSSGSYYTPDAFVRFLVEKTLGPQVAERSPVADPDPLAILRLKVLDPAMGSGHFLVGACRFLADKLYEACRLCDERARALREKSEATEDVTERARLVAESEAMLGRVQALPDPNDELLAYLPSRVAEGSEAALSQAKAEAMCRRLVAIHCLYGVDKNPLAVELARLALWLESYAEGLPLTFLDHRLVCGDSLTGPFIEQLGTMPGGAAPLSGGLFTRLTGQLLAARMTEALAHVTALEASIGKDDAEVTQKRAAKAKLDAALAPFRLLASVWTGGVMLGNDAGDDTGYASLVALAAQEDGDAVPAMESFIAQTPKLGEMRSLGRDAVSYDLTFPEVFWPKGYAGERAGFDAVLGNPPWEGIDTSIKEFLAGFDLSILDATTEDAIRSISEKLLRRPEISHCWNTYCTTISGYNAVTSRAFTYTNLSADGKSGATPDMYQGFLERSHQLSGHNGFIGQVLPASIHANEGAAGLRRMILWDSSLKFCFSFENRLKLFDIDSRYKFATLVTCRTSPNEDSGFECAFYLRDPAWLFDADRRNALRYTPGFVREVSGELLNFPELRSNSDVDVVKSVASKHLVRWGTWRESLSIRMTEELHKSKNRWRLVPRSSLAIPQISDPRLPDDWNIIRKEGMLPFAEGKTIHQFNDTWEEPPEFLVALDRMTGKEDRLKCAEYFRLAFRTVASSTNERSAIFAVLPPGSLCSNSMIPESRPWTRTQAAVLQVASVSNTFCFDWLLRLVVAANITFNFLDAVPVPSTLGCERFLAHSALRLSCNHAGYTPLWREQLGDAWCEDAPRETWPVLAGDDARWAVRAAIDAVVAQAYGLTRAQYAHVLGGFSHKSYPKAPALCLARYDELARDGLDAFVRAWDPYWDVPLVETLPKPVIELRAPAAPDSDGEKQLGLAGIASAPPGRGRKKKG